VHSEEGPDLLGHQSDFVTDSGREITADQRSMIGRKLFLIGEEARLPFILLGRIV
jgi:hypothetical protein